jgi:hypothetical protein
MREERTKTMKTTRNHLMSARRGATIALAAICLALVGPSSASAAPDVYSVTTISPSKLVAGAPGRMLVELNNKASSGTTSGLKLTIDLPAGVTLTGKTVGWPANNVWSCSGAGTSTVSCTTSSSISAFGGSIGTFPSGPSSLMLDVAVPAGTTGAFPLSITVADGGLPTPSVETRPVEIAATFPSFGMHGVSAGAVDGAGDDFVQAGGHPTDVVADFALNIDKIGTRVTDPTTPSGGAVRDVVVETPPGFVGDPAATPKCTQQQMAEGGVKERGCPDSAQVGTILVRTPIVGNFEVALYNLVPPADLPAQFAFWTPVGIVRVEPKVRSDGDYGLSTNVNTITQADVLLRSNAVLWGDPSDPSHDGQRCPFLNIPTHECIGVDTQGIANPLSLPHSFDGPEKAFLSMPTNCVKDQVTTIRLDRWNDPAPLDDLADPRWTQETLHTPKMTGCEQVPFGPNMELDPTSSTSDSPTGLDAHLHIPRGGDSDPDGLVQAHLKRTTVKLPAGLALNASAATGLEGCSIDQIGLTSQPGQLPVTFDNREPSCPDASKIGSGEISTPLLEDDLRGEVFLASQDQNPFGSTYAVYIVVREPSILVKLAGRIDPDPVTGQVTATFDQNPQLPFEDLHLSFYPGPRAAMVTPPTCGDFTSTTEMVPWSAKDPDNPTPGEVVTDPDPFELNSAPAGAACASSPAQLPFGLGFDAGNGNPLAGAHSPFAMRLTRPDGAQEIDRLELTMPEGFSAKVKGVPYCSDAQIAVAKARSGRAEQASPSCPGASRIGTTLVGAGAGDPYYVPGKLYLAGPYKGFDLSLVAVVPAVAGPFDLGVQVVRAALQVDPRTAQITAVTDPIPTILEGVPLRVRDIRIDIDRPGFVLNPTDCSAQRIAAKVFGAAGAVADLSTRFQVGGCENLGFKPRLSIQLKGGTKRGDHPGLRATLRARPGDANIARAAVTLPRSAFLDQARIRTICTRVQFAANACPKGAIYGYARGTSPLIDGTIEGPVYMRSSDNTLPDLVADLDGQVDVELVGRIDSSKRGGLRSTFDVVPDAPVSRFTLTMRGGKKGLVVNSTNLCAATNRASVRLTAHNGMRRNFRPVVVARGCKKKGRRAPR